MAGPIQNADGLTVKMANYFSDKKNFFNRAREVTNFGAYSQVEFDVDLTLIPAGTTAYTSDLNNDGTLDGFNNGDLHLPANSSVKEVVILTKEAAVGGTSFTLGTYQLNGTAIAATGLVTATEGVLANVNTIGKRTYGAGALVSTSVGTAGVGTADAYLAFATVGTFTAGKLRVIVTYMNTTVDS